MPSRRWLGRSVIGSSGWSEDSSRSTGWVAAVSAVRVGSAIELAPLRCAALDHHPRQVNAAEHDGCLCDCSIRQPASSDYRCCPAFSLTGPPDPTPFAEMNQILYGV